MPLTCPGQFQSVTEIFAASAPFTMTNQFQFQSWETVAKESDGSVVVTVLRTGPATTAASVDYAIEDGTAKAGTDFKATGGTLNFAAGQTANTFTVSLVPADRFSGTRSAVLVLSNPQGASLGYPSAVLDLTANSTSTPTSTPTSTSNTESDFDLVSDFDSNVDSDFDPNLDSDFDFNSDSNFDSKLDSNTGFDSNPNPTQTSKSASPRPVSR